MKNYLEKRQKALMDKREKLIKRSQESEDVNEVRAINDELMDIANELHDIADELAKLSDNGDGDGSNGDGGRPADGGQRSFNPIATYGMGAVAKRDANAGTTDSMEYRTAFMNYVLRNKPIPAEVREAANTTTTDVASVIPTVLVNRIVESMEECGMILPLVTRTSYAAGVVIPTSTVRPVATWVAEGASSDAQEKTTGKITFSYNKLRCEISMSMEVGTMAISAFETAFVANVADAMTIAIEKAILNGNGSGQPKGILTETPAAAITLKDAVPTYAELTQIEGKVGAQWESTAKWCMTKAQFMAILGMVDSNGQPIARIDYGIDGKAERRILGREVVIHPYATEMGTNVAFIFDFNDYVLNTIYDLGISKKQDWDTEDIRTKAVMSVDGKVINAGSLVTVVAGA